MLIFDSFLDREHAEAFADAVKDKYIRQATVYDSQDESDKVDLFPGELVPSIVLVERLNSKWWKSEDWTTDSLEEDEIIELVEKYTGTFAGT